VKDNLRFAVDLNPYNTAIIAFTPIANEAILSVPQYTELFIIANGTRFVPRFISIPDTQLLGRSTFSLVYFYFQRVKNENNLISE